MDLTKAKWKDVEPNIWKQENKGDQIAGILIRIEPANKEKETSARYYIQNEKGTFMVWGTAVLEDRMACVNVGELVRITYEGTELNSKKQKVHMFKVETAEIPTDNKEEKTPEVEEVAEPETTEEPVSVEDIEPVSN